MNKLTIDKTTVREALKANVIIGDGHTLFAPSFYEPYFDVKSMGLVRTHRSDGTPKGTIFSKGEPVEKLEAVYNLEFLEYLVDVLDLPYPTAMGRGSAAQQIVDSVKKWCDENESN